MTSSLRCAVRESLRRTDNNGRLTLAPAQAKNLKICITAGVGSDHIDLNAAVERGIEVLEVSGSNVVSVAEHVVMSILLLVRNFVPAHEVRRLPVRARGDVILIIWMLRTRCCR